MEDLVDRSARLRLPVESAEREADVHRHGGHAVAGSSSSACFAAGTLVHTVDGPRPIESIQVGDRVLSQNTSTGMLGFQPVVAVHRNKPAATLRVSIGGETIVATGIHRFWKAGKGWTMARDLKPGDSLAHARRPGHRAVDRDRQDSAGL